MHFLMILFLSIFFLGSVQAEIPADTLKNMPAMNKIYHPVSTKSREAQENFDLGLTYTYAYNHDLAYRHFEEAALLDPDLAMAYWGMALALGQNINMDVTPENEAKSYKLIQHALKLSSKASENEQAYIHALSKRYTNDPHADLVPLRFLYRNAMKKVVEAYPEDLDASTLYSESILALDPWKWWTPEGKAKEGVYEAIDRLEFVLERNPFHIGANHFYIHAVEESPFPERALMSAHRLTTLLPESGHLLHMPCHIFIIVGDYDTALSTNKRAIAADRNYIKEYGMSGTYPLHYLPHNLYILTRIYMLKGDYENAIKAAQELNQFIAPYADKDSHLHRMACVPYEVYLYFHKWKEILAYRPLAEKSNMVQGYAHFSRGLAYAELGDLNSAKKEMQEMIQSKKKIPQDFEIANNPALKLFDLAELILNAKIKSKEGHSREAIGLLQQAFQLQDRFSYDEPPACFISIRQLLGKAFLNEGRWQEAEETFRKALNNLQRNGRLLFGLAIALKEQGKTIDAYWVEREMTEATRGLKEPLKLDDL